MNTRSGTTATEPMTSDEYDALVEVLPPVTLRVPGQGARRRVHVVFCHDTVIQGWSRDAGSPACNNRWRHQRKRSARNDSMLYYALADVPTCVCCIRAVRQLGELMEEAP